MGLYRRKTSVIAKQFRCFKNKSLFIISAIFFAFCFSAVASTKTAYLLDELSLDLMASNQKLSNDTQLLSPFERGDKTISVVVSLKRSNSALELSALSLEINGLEQQSALSVGTNGPYYDLTNESIKTQLANSVKTELDNLFQDISSFNDFSISSNGNISHEEIEITNKFKYSFGFAANVTPLGLSYLLNNDKVVLIEENLVLTPQIKQGVGLMNGTSTRLNYKGDGVAVAIVDTGIDDSHPDLNNGKVLGGYDFGDDDTNFRPTSTGNAHGTAVGGIVAGDVNNVGDYIGGVASDAKLYGLKISPGDQGSASSADMVDAWEWVITNQNNDPNNPILVVNTSFGGGRYTASCNSRDSSMTQAALNGVNAGISHFVSSGNDGYCDAMGWPACISHVNSVGAVYDAPQGRRGWCLSTSSCLATTPNPGCAANTEAFFEDTGSDQVTAYSNTDTNLTLFAPSNNASTTDITGSGGYNTAGNYTTTFGGTSAAAPYSSGAAAVLQSAAKTKIGRFLTPAEVTQFLVNNGSLTTDGKSGITKRRVDLGASVAALPTNTIPDLIVESPSVSKASLTTGEAFNLSVTVRNQGTGTSNAASLRYFSSTNSFISVSDTEIGTDNVISLAPNGTDDETELVSISQVGTFWVGACVEAVNGETETSNQCSTGVQVVVTSSTTTQPDLIVESPPSVSKNSVTTGEAFNISVTVRNQGTGASNPASLRYFSSTNSFISISDTEIGTDSVISLAPNGTDAETEPVSISQEGTFWVGACVEVVADESETTNQCSTGVQVVVSNPLQPDLIVESPSVSKTSLTVGENFDISVNVRNQGTGTSSSASLRYFSSTNSDIAVTDTQIGTDIVASLAPNGIDDETESVSISEGGTFWVGACVEAVVGESDTSNQCSIGIQVNISSVLPDIYEPNDSAETAKEILNNILQNHSLHVANDQDWMSFDIDSEVTNLTIETSGDSGDTRLWLYDSTISELEFNDDTNGLFSRITRDSLSAGRYYILVNEFNPSSTMENYQVIVSYTTQSGKNIKFIPAMILNLLE